MRIVPTSPHQERKIESGVAAGICTQQARGTAQIEVAPGN
jgi:hypothetical protein